MRRNEVNPIAGRRPREKESDEQGYEYRFDGDRQHAASERLRPGWGPAGSGSTGGSDGKLIVYTNSNSDGRGEWLQQKAKEAGFDIQIVGAGGGDVVNKLIAEKNNPVADVAFGLNNVYFSQLKSEGVLDPYTPKWSSNVDGGLGDSGTEKSYWPLVKQAILLTYDADRVSKDQAPTDWTDLWSKDQYKSRYERVTDLSGATTQLVMAGILSRYRDEKGDLGVSDAGWKQVEQYFQNGVPAVKKVDLFARFAKGEADYGQMPSSTIAAQEKAQKVKTGAVVPAIGVPYAVEQAGIIKGSKNQAQAQKFIDWFGADDIQGQWAKQFNSLPVNQKALPSANPAALAIDQQFKAQDIDWAFVQKNLGPWMEKIQLQYMK
ncbi:probable ABC transporter periplasmic-binding protein y4fP [Arthrobacter sp. Hiyo6]|nr:probable ABC transporter periplasmic-binding protein y4fP [Arthrobacter sp. Hiyo6]